MATRSQPSDRVPGVAPARAAAHRALLRMERHDAYLDLAFRPLEQSLSPRDRPLARVLAFGTVQRQLTLDAVLARLARRPLAKIDLPALVSLRLGLFELLYLDGSPARAVVHDQVELTRRRMATNARRAEATAGLVNAVLRAAAREGKALLRWIPWQGVEGLALRHSHPLWLTRLWVGLLGVERARALLEANNRPPEIALRANTLKADPKAAFAGLPERWQRDPLLEEAVVASGKVELGRLAGWRRGELVAQSRGAMLAAHLLAPRPGERVLDLCAAPGLKTTHLAALMENQGELVAVERNRGRAGRLAKLAAKLGASCVRVVERDGRAIDDLGQFDRVLVDAPCSGLGTLQRHPELRLRVTPARVRELAGLQLELLRAAAAALRPGGVLLYATCTLSPAENEANVAALLGLGEGLELRDLAAEGGPFALHRAYALRYRPGPVAEVAARALLTLPSLHSTAGFFYAALIKRAGGPAHGA